MSRYLAATLVLAAGMLGCQKEEVGHAYGSIAASEMSVVQGVLGPSGQPLTLFCPGPGIDCLEMSNPKLPIPKELEIE